MSDPAPSRGGSTWSDLTLRIVSGVAMAAVALAAAWWGGWPFATFWTIAAVAVLFEWLTMVTGVRQPAALPFGGAGIVTAAVLAATGRPILALLVLLLSALVVLLLLRKSREPHLAAFGVLYAGAIGLPAILLRGDTREGMVSILFLFAIVWGSDVMAYFTGRTLGGPKLWPSISPKKTWSGFLGGTLCGALAGTAVAMAAGHGASLPMACVAYLLAVVSQGGDLFESAIKRRFGTKDASQLIPGHGGVMDRLDGFVAAATLGLVIAAWRDPAVLPAGLLAF